MSLRLWRTGKEVRKMSRRIITSLLTILLAVAMVAGATTAFFSDTEISKGNTFAAGELDLKIDNTSYGFDWNDPTKENPTGQWGLNQTNSWSFGDLNNCGPNKNGPCLFFNFADLKPGDYGEDTISLHVQNDAWACMAMTLVEKPENGVANPETTAGDNTNNGTQDGELQDYLNFAFWKDDGDNVYEEGEGDLLFQGPASKLNGQWNKLADSTGGGSLSAQSEPSKASAYIGKFWCFGEMEPKPVSNNGDNPPTATTTGFICNGAGNHNIAQTDGIKVDVAFQAIQARHNANFTCASLNTEQ